MHVLKINKKQAAGWAPNVRAWIQKPPESMELGSCAVHLEDACTPSVLLQSGTDVNDFLLVSLVERCSM